MKPTAAAVGFGESFQPILGEPGRLSYLGSFASPVVRTDGAGRTAVEGIAGIGWAGVSGTPGDGIIG